MTARRALVGVSALAAVWTLLLIATGGFVFHLGPLRISSQFPRTPLIIALFSGLTAWALSLHEGRETGSEASGASVIRRAGLLTTLVLGLSMLFLFQPAPPENQNNCLFVHELGVGMRHLLNCDAVEYLALANTPSMVLTPEHPYRQSRPLSFVAPHLVAQPLRLSSWLVRHGPYPPYGPEFVAFALINLVVLVASLFCFLRVLRMAVPGVTLGMEVLFCLIVLAANDVTKLFFWSPHAQIYNLFVPCMTLYMNLRMLDAGRPLTWRGALLLGVGLGVGLLMYGSFSVALVCACAIQLFRYRSVVPTVLIGGMAVATYAAWVLYVRSVTGSFYSYEIEMYRQFIWLVECYQAGRDACVPIFVQKSWQFYNRLAQMILVPLLLILAVRLARLSVPSEGEPMRVNRHLPSAIAGCAGVASLLLLSMGDAFNMPRLYWILIPPLLVVLAIELQHLQSALTATGKRVLSGVVFAGALVHLVVLMLRQGPYQ